MKNTSFSKNLKRVIETRRLRLKAISDGTGIPVSTLSEWTSGRQPKLSQALIELTRFLGISLDELISDRSKATLRVSEASSHINIEGVEYCVRIQKLNNKRE